MTLDLTLDARALASNLVKLIAALDAAYALSQILVFGFGWRPNSLLLVLVDLNHEMNLPSAFSGAQLLLAAALLAWTAAAERRRGAPCAAWAVLSAAFVFLSADEVMAIHEKLNGPLRAALHTTGGAFHFAWLIPYAAAAAAMGLLYIPFLLRLPRKTSGLFILAGSIFVGGAAGCELIGGILQAGSVEKTLPVVVEIFVEETLEMGGIALFIYAILGYLQAEFPGLSLRVGLREASPEKS